MKLMKYQARKMFRPMLAYVLALLTIISSVPFGVFANDGVETLTEPELLQPFSATILGKDMIVPANGIVALEVEGFNELVEFELPRYVHLDGERISINDDRIENIAPVVVDSDNGARSVGMPPVGFIVAFSTPPAQPPQELPGWIPTANVTMNGSLVNPMRYAVYVNGVEYEAFCANPNLPGPEHAGVVYTLGGTVTNNNLVETLRYGYQVNPINKS